MKVVHLFPTSLQTRFVLGMGVMLLPLVVVAVGAFLSLQSVIAAFDEVVQEASVEIANVARLQVLIRRARGVAHDYFIPGLGDEGERQRFLDLNQEVEKAFQEATPKTFPLEEERELIRSAQAEWERGRSIGEGILPIPNPSRNPIAVRGLERLDVHLERALDTLDRVHSLSMREMGAHLKKARDVRRTGLIVIAAVSLAGLAAAILVGTLLARSVLLPLHALEEAATRFGSGNLSHRVTMATGDELGELAKTFNVMAERLAKVQEELEDLSIHDGLTGLYNFREFHRQLAEEAERCWRYGHSLSLLMLDIDHFKSVNDSFGHLAGDDVLRALAARIHRECRPADRIARYGGEEFAILLPETGAFGALAMAERIRDFLASYAIPLGPGPTVNLTVSIGVAIYPEDADSAEKLIGAADQALYAAKKAGRNRVSRFGKA